MNVPTETFVLPTEDWEGLEDEGFIPPAEDWKLLETEADFAPPVDDWRDDEFQTRDGFAPPAENWEDFVAPEPETSGPESAEEAPPPELISPDDAEKIKRRQAAERRRAWDNRISDKRITDIDLPERNDEVKKEMEKGLGKWWKDNNVPQKVGEMLKAHPNGIKMAEFAAGLAAGGILINVSKLDPQVERGIVGMVSALPLELFGISTVAQKGAEFIGGKYPRAAEAAAKIAVGASVVREVSYGLMTRPFFVGFMAGMMGESIFEGATASKPEMSATGTGDDSYKRVEEIRVDRGGVQPPIQPPAEVRPPSWGGVGLGTEYKHEFGQSGAVPLPAGEKGPDWPPHTGWGQTAEHPQQIINNLPTAEAANLAGNHWSLADLWSKPIAEAFKLSDGARDFLTDTVYDIANKQGALNTLTEVVYDKQAIGNYLREALEPLKNMTQEQLNNLPVKMTVDDIGKLQQIADMLGF